MINPAIRRIYVADVSDIMPHRSTKYCVCVSVGAGKYLMINTDHRELYDDFKISSSDYMFLKGVDRFLGCWKAHVRTPSQLIREVGVLSEADTRQVIAKIIDSHTIRSYEKAPMLAELSKALQAR